MSRPEQLELFGLGQGRPTEAPPPAPSAGSDEARPGKEPARPRPTGPARAPLSRYGGPLDGVERSGRKPASPWLVLAVWVVILFAAALGVRALWLLAAGGGEDVSEEWELPADAETTLPEPAPVAPTPREAGALSAHASSGFADALKSVPGVSVREDGPGWRVVFDEGLFAKGAQWTPVAVDRLRRVGLVLRSEAVGREVTVVGHTDNQPMRKGSPLADNRVLGLRRAQAAAAVLAPLVAPDIVLRLHSQGPDDPPYANDGVAGRRRNRTVTLRVR